MLAAWSLNNCEPTVRWFHLKRVHAHQCFAIARLWLVKFVISCRFARLVQQRCFYVVAHPCPYSVGIPSEARKLLSLVSRR